MLDLKVAVLLSTQEVGYIPLWTEQLRKHAPELDLRVWPDVGQEEDIQFAVVARPPTGDLARYPNLKAIFSMWAGVADLLLEKSIAHVPIVRMTEPGLTIGMVTYVVHHVTGLHILSSEYKVRSWTHPFRVDNKAPNCTCVGILGMGFLGAACAKALTSLGFEVIGYSNSRKNIPNVQSYAGKDELKEFLGRSQILVSLLPNTSGTHNLLNRQTLGYLPVGAKIINCGRGESIDDDALLEALRSGHVSRAVLDVFRTEPLPPDDPYWDEPNVLVTPHCASIPDPETGSIVILEKMAKFLNGESIEGVVDRTRAY